MSTCYQLIGLPGVGKSTWIEQQQIVKNYAVVSTDAWVEKVAREKCLTYNEVFDEAMQDAVKQMMFSVRVAQRERCDIIWDQTSLTVNSRLKKFNALPDYAHVAVLFIPPDEIEHARRLNREGKIIPAGILKSMKQSYQAPSLDEGFKEIWVIT
jgi:cytidylate kinase